MSRNGKGWLSIFLTLLFLLALLPASAAAATVVASGTCSSSYSSVSWSLDSDGLMTISGSGTMKDYIFSPGSYPPWYPRRAAIKALCVESGVTSIGSYAFGDCSSLASVSLADSVLEIGKSAFRGCTGLTDAAIPEGVRTLGCGAFEGCTSLTSIHIPASVTAIRDYVEVYNSDSAFQGCTSLTDITVSVDNQNFKDIDGVLFDKSETKLVAYPGGRSGAYAVPTSVITVGGNAFEGCVGLTEVSIPASVTSLGSYSTTDYCPFKGCTSLNSITIDSDNPNYSDIGGVLCSKDETELIRFPAGKTGSFVIPSSVTIVKNNAFEGCTGLTSVSIPAGVSIIRYNAFRGCTGLTEVSIPATVTSLGYGVFEGCTSLRSASISGGVTQIGYNTFKNCSSLTTVSIPDCVTSIGSYAFSGCRSLTGMLLPANLTDIGEYAFENCYSLTGMTIPDSVSEMGESVFLNCYRMTVVTLPASLEYLNLSIFSLCSGLTEVHVSVNSARFADIDGVLFDKAMTKLLFYPGGRSGEYVIPDGVKTIAEGAFGDCPSLTVLTVPVSVTTIEDYAVNDCYSLTDVYYGGIYSDWERVVRLDYNYSLQNVTLHALIARGICGTDLIWSLDENGVLTFSGSGDMSTSASDSEWVSYMGRDAVRSIRFEEGVTGIYDMAFIGCSNLTEVSIPASVTSIGNSCFYNCVSLTGIHVNEDNPNYADIDGVLFNKDKTTLICCPGGWRGDYIVPASVTSISNSCFYNCVSLTGIHVSEDNPNYADIDGVLFNKDKTTLICCSGGRSGAYAIPAGTDAIANSAFSRCGLTVVSIPASVTAIQPSSFSACPYMTDIRVSADNPNYADIDGVLYNKAGTALITYPCGRHDMYSVPTGVNSIGQGAFFDCENLTGVYIPMSVTEIQMYAFSGCTALSDVYYGGTVSEWEGITVSLVNDSLTAANLHDNALPLGIASLRVNKTTVVVDDTVVWTVTASDGNGAKQYRFDIYRDGQLIGQGSYNSANTCTYAVTDAGIFSVRVYVKDSISLTVSRDGGSVTVTDPGAAPVTTEIAEAENSGDTVRAAVRCGEAGSAAIYAARYGSGGQFLSLEIWQLTSGYNEVTVPRGEAIMVRFFVLDENYTPLCAPAEVPIA